MTITFPWPFRCVPPTQDVYTYSSYNKVIPAISLHHYSTPGIAPPSARLDSSYKLQVRPPLRLWDVWKYGFVAAAKVTEVTSDVLSHHIWGPRKKSWGIEMTIVTSFMRGAGRHSSLVDIATIRTLMSLGGLFPLPSDALVTPVSFRVKRRQLRGILAQFDACESGTRELSGEWVVGRKTWQRLQSEWKASRQNAPTQIPQTKERVILYIHGGAYCFSSAAAQRLISIPLAKYSDCRVFALDYRLAPESRFPGPLHDAVCGYLRLVEDLHIPPENIVICGDSAGGGLSLALLMYLRDNEYPLPSSAILLSPWVDLTMSCDSWESNATYDIIPCPTVDSHLNPIGLYLGVDTGQYLTHPYASPLFGDFTGLPPLLIQAGEAEVLRDEITLLAHKASRAGVEVRHELYEDAVHVFQAFPFFHATRRAFTSIRSFVHHTLPQWQSRSPQLLAVSAERNLELEIENEASTVVDMNGVETGTGVRGLEEKLGGPPSEDSTDLNDEDLGEQFEVNGPKLRHRNSHIWSIYSSSTPVTSGLPPATQDTPCTTNPLPPPKEDMQTPHYPQTTAGMSRIRSAISLILPASQGAVPPSPTLPSPVQFCPPRPRGLILRRYSQQDRPQSSLFRIPKFLTRPPSPTDVKTQSSSCRPPEVASVVPEWELPFPNLGASLGKARSIS